MSEPVKNTEIEDVLSSIRRLVSEDQRKTVPRTQEVSPVAPTRFVLTEALRVAEPEPEDSAPQETEAESQDVDLGASEPDFVEEVAHADDDGDDLQSDSPDDDVSGEDTAFDQPETDLEEVELEEASSQDDVEDHVSDDVFEASDDLAVVETAIADEGDTDHPWSDPDATLYEAAGLSDGGDDPSEDEDAPMVADAPMDTGDVRPLGDKIAALEKVIARTEDQWEPDDPGMDDYAGTDVETLEWEDTSPEDAQETAAAPVPEPDPEPEAAVADIDDLDREEALLDEDALRELVADIVREELQGALGERITRNVRKLVRREIHRALAVQDLE